MGNLGQCREMELDRALESTMLDWRTAYFMQARSDYEIFKRLVVQDDIPLCQLLHYLQMASEKFAKGFLTAPGGEPYPKTHNAFQLFVKVCRDRPEIRRLLDTKIMAHTPVISRGFCPWRA